MWPKFGNSSISMRILHNLNFITIWLEKPIFLRSALGSSLGIAPGMGLKFYNSVARELKLIVRRFWGQTPAFQEVTREKMAGEGFGFLPTYPK